MVKSRTSFSIKWHFIKSSKLLWCAAFSIQWAKKMVRNGKQIKTYREKFRPLHKFWLYVTSITTKHTGRPLIISPLVKFWLMGWCSLSLSSWHGISIHLKKIHLCAQVIDTNSNRFRSVEVKTLMHFSVTPVPLASLQYNQSTWLSKGHWSWVGLWGQGPIINSIFDFG